MTVWGLLVSLGWRQSVERILVVTPRDFVAHRESEPRLVPVEGLFRTVEAGTKRDVPRLYLD
jgi:hypothetical protein